MKSYTSKDPLDPQEKDLTIIYKKENDKLYEMKAKKNDIIQSFSRFKEQQKEIDSSNIIYIQESIPFDIFKAFINVIYTCKLDINGNNNSSYLYLANKYGNDEVKHIVEEYNQKYPDISSTTKNPVKIEEEKIGGDKIEIFAQNLDACIKNEHLKKLPIQVLARILTSPNRVINDHHLLFNFVIEILKEKLSDEKLSDEERSSLAILPSSLDFCLMSNDEIIELINIEKDEHFTSPRHTNDRLKKMIENENEMKNKYDSLEQKVTQIETIYKQKFSELEQKVQLIEMAQKKEIEKQSIINNTNHSQFQEITKKQSREDEQINLINKNITKAEQLIKEIRSNQQKADQKIQTINSKLTSNDEINLLKQEQKNNETKIQNSINCENGIFKYLFEKFKSSPIDKGLIEISGNSNNDDETIRLPKIIDHKYAGSYWYSKDVENSFIKIKFKNSSVLVKKYWIREGLNEFSEGFFTSWIVKGVTENNQEIILDEVDDTKEITPIHPEITRFIQNNHFIKSIEFIMKGKNKSNCYKFRVRNIEIFGYFIETDN